MTQRPVVVVGAGAAGATAALLLARYDIPTVVLERRSRPLAHPAAHVLNATSFEIWERADPELARRVAALSPPLDEIGTIRWASDLHDAIAELDLRDEPEELELVRSFSPYLRSHVGQHLLMPELWDALDREPLVTFRRGVEVTGVDMTADGTVRLATTAAGSHEPLDARYVIAADGANSRLREAAGIDLEGPVLAQMGSAFVHAPGLYPDGDRPLLTWIYRPDFAGVLIAHADDCYVLMTVYLHPHQEIARSGRTYWERTVASVLGRADDVQIRSTGTWTMTSQVATRFRSRGVLLVGDAAHRFPHTGGFGLNSGVQDADNLAWKLDAVLNGGAADALLDTYQSERRPVIERFADYSVANHFKLDEVTKAFGVTNRSLMAATRAVARPPLSWLPGPLVAGLAERATRLQLGRTAGLDPSSRRSARLRAHVARTVPDQVEHFVATGLEFGYGYDGPLVANESGAPRVQGNGVRHHVPTTWPGRRLPYVPVLDGDVVVPIHRLVRERGLTLLTSDEGAWQAWTDAERPATPLPLTTRHVSMAGDPAQASATAALLEVGPRGAVVVRPDMHVVWRSSDGPDRAGSELARFLQGAWAPLWDDVVSARPSS